MEAGCRNSEGRGRFDPYPEISFAKIAKFIDVAFEIFVLNIYNILQAISYYKTVFHIVLGGIFL